MHFEIFDKTRISNSKSDTKQPKPKISISSTSPLFDLLNSRMQTQMSSSHHFNFFPINGGWPLAIIKPGWMRRHPPRIFHFSIQAFLMQKKCTTCNKILIFNFLQFHKSSWKKSKNGLNIARGTTDPGYWVCNLNQISDWSQFENIIQVTDSIPWVRCASGNVFPTRASARQTSSNNSS